jgi:hypothetical protein
MNNKIDNLLKKWDKCSSSGICDSEKMAENIKHAVKHTPAYEHEPHLKIVHKNWLYAAAAAIIILAATVGILIFQLNNSQHYTEFPGVKKAELVELKKINDELQLLFPNSLKSFCIVNGSITINTQDDKTTDTPKEKKQQLLVRYSVMQKKNGQWVTTTQNDIVTAIGRNLLLTDNGITPKGYIWSWPADKNIIALESNINLLVGKKKYPIKFFSGQKLNTTKILKESQNIRIYQTVNLI